MTLAFRIIARLDIRNDRLIKPVRCEGVRPVGDPAEFIRRYDAEGIDEVYLHDAVASLYGRNALAGLIDAATEHAFVPVCVAGGIRSEDDVRELLNAGADKVAVNTAAVEDPGLIDRLATRFGSSTIVLQLDAKRTGDGWEARTHGARQRSGRCAVAWAREAVNRGVGEVVATGIDHEGVGRGFDIRLVEQLAPLPVPVVVSGGFAGPQDAVAAYEAGAQGVAVAGALHYSRVALADIRNTLQQHGVPVRCASSSLAPMGSSAAISPSI